MSTEERNRVIYDRFIAGDTLAEIGNDYGVSRQRVHQIVRDQSSSLEPSNRRRRCSICGEVDHTASRCRDRGPYAALVPKVLSLRRQHRFTIAEIAQQCGCSCYRVRDVLAHHMGPGERDSLKLKGSNEKRERNQKMYERWANGESMVSIARSYGIGPRTGTVSRIIARERKRKGEEQYNAAKA